MCSRRGVAGRDREMAGSGRETAGVTCRHLKFRGACFNLTRHEMSNDEQPEDKAIRLTIPRRVLVVPATAFVVGTAIGIMRGGRAASLRFLAENAHRPPTTVQGWYFYKKTKNYRVMLGALKGAGSEAGKLTALGLAYVGIEEGLVRAGWAPAKDVGAAVGTALVFSTVCE